MARPTESDHLWNLDSLRRSHLVTYFCNNPCMIEFGYSRLQAYVLNCLVHSIMYFTNWLEWRTKLVWCVTRNFSLQHVKTNSVAQPTSAKPLTADIFAIFRYALISGQHSEEWVEGEKYYKNLRQLPASFQCRHLSVRTSTLMHGYDTPDSIRCTTVIQIRFKIIIKAVIFMFMNTIWYLAYENKWIHN